MLNRLTDRLANILLRIIPVRWQYILWQLRSGEPHETDIQLFSYLDDVKGQVLDLGANFGQFALSVFAINRSLRIESWEPNPELRLALRFVKCLHPCRFRYRTVGASDQAGGGTLHVPVSKHQDLSTNASMDLDEFEKDYVDARLQQYSDHQGYQLRAVKVKVKPVDDGQYAPLVIKIDVEGWELQVLQGMQRTLSEHHPMLMIEVNNSERWFSWLRQQGYHIFSLQQNPALLLPVAQHTSSLNVFCLHPQSPAQLLQPLQPLLPAGWQET